MITELSIFITIKPTMLVILEPTMLLRTDKIIFVMRTITHAPTVTMETMVTTVVVNLANRNSHVSLAIKVTMLVVMEHR